MMRLAGADLIPVDYSPQAEAIAKYEAELEKLLKDKQDEFAERNLQLQEGVFTAIADPRRPTVPPPAEIVPPYMNFAPMKNAIDRLKKSAERYSKALGGLAGQGFARASRAGAGPGECATCLKVPRLFLNEKGLPERPWFKNQIYAPGAYTGYGAKPIAAVREYMDEKKWKEAEEQVPQVAEVIENVAAGIDKAADAPGGRGRPAVPGLSRARRLRLAAYGLDLARGQALLARGARPEGDEVLVIAARTGEGRETLVPGFEDREARGREKSEDVLDPVAILAVRAFRKLEIDTVGPAQKGRSSAECEELEALHVHLQQAHGSGWEQVVEPKGGDLDRARSG